MRDLHEQGGQASLAWDGVIAARNHYRQALALDRQLGGTSPDEASRRAQLDMHERLRELAMRLGHYADAREQGKQAVALATGLSEMKKVGELEHN